MPIYEYLCNDCKVQFEHTQKITEDALSVCPHCGGSQLKRLISATAFHLKGTGWYKTDYASNKNGSANTATSDKSKETSSTDSKASEGSSSDKKSIESTSNEGVKKEAPKKEDTKKETAKPASSE